MTSDGSTFARWAMRRMVVASRPRSPNSARAASRMRWAVAARLAARLPGSLTPFTLPLLSEWCTVDRRDRRLDLVGPGLTLPVADCAAGLRADEYGVDGNGV